jgi:hypothetical protein
MPFGILSLPYTISPSAFAIIAQRATGQLELALSPSLTMKENH